MHLSLPRGLSLDSQRRARMEVLKEKVEEEEEAEREEAAKRGKKMMRPVEMWREEPPMTQEMLRDLEKKLSEIEIVIPEQPSCVSGWGLWAWQPWRGSDQGRAKEEPDGVGALGLGGRTRCRGKQIQVRALLSTCLVLVPSLPLMSCVTLGKSLSLSGPPFPSLFKIAHDNDIPSGQL